MNQLNGLRFFILIFSLAAFAGCSSEADATSESAIRIYVVRHAQAFKNLEAKDRPEGLDAKALDSLTEKGKVEGSLLGQWLKEKGVVRVCTSPLGRAQETAELICATIPGAYKPVVDQRLRSLKKGTTPEGAKVSWGWRTQQWADGKDPKPEGGESLAEGQTRALAMIQEFLATKPTGSMTVVSHGDICAALIGHAANCGLTQCWSEHEVAGGSVSSILVKPDGTWSLEAQGIVPE